MVKIQLRTEDGREVTTIECFPFQRWPEIVVWGARHFVLRGQPLEGTQPDYREGFAWYVPPPIQEAHGAGGGPG